MDLVRKFVGNETTAHFSKVFQDYLPLIESAWLLISQKMKESFNLASDHLSTIRGKLMEYFPLLMKYVGVTVDAARASLPYLKNIEVYCVEKIKQHPYLFGFIVLLVLFNYCTSGGSAGNSRKMMKAPGRPYRMPRDVFESNPRSYFRSERKRK